VLSAKLGMAPPRTVAGWWLLTDPFRRAASVQAAAGIRHGQPIGLWIAVSRTQCKKRCGSELSLNARAHCEGLSIVLVVKEALMWAGRDVMVAIVGASVWSQIEFFQEPRTLSFKAQPARRRPQASV
jgi:hypothetical protein